MEYKLRLDKITGVRVLNPYTPVLIRDKRGILFYTTEGMTPRIKVFNLPPGEYIHYGNIALLAKPKKQKYSKLPKPERRFKPPTDYKVEFANNPSKCTIYWDQKKIVYDKSFLQKPIPYVFYILYHEFGHSLYNTEHYADLYAANMMKKRGYNTSQIGLAQLNSLSPHQMFRKKYLINKLVNASS